MLSSSVCTETLVILHMYRSILVVLLMFCVGIRSIGQAQRYDVIIEEIMARPNPRVGLPANKWLELKNTSAHAINLQGWHIAWGNTRSGAMPAYIIKPDSFLIICSTLSLPVLRGSGPAIGITLFPTLTLAGQMLSLVSNDSRVIHSVNYQDTWYKDDVKKGGGWSLEMIDTHNPCSGISNWKASINVRGGTPGDKNSVSAINSDHAPPQLISAFASDSLNVTLTFNESLDSTTASALINYNISDGIRVQSVRMIAPMFQRVRLKLQDAVVRNKVYLVTVTGVTDCSGNTIGTKNHARLGLSSVADSLSVVINEILFNPRPGGVDYVELYNRSGKIVNCRQLYVANRNSGGVMSTRTQLTRDSLLLFPGDYLLLTTDPPVVLQQYVSLHPEAFLAVTSLPSFANDKGSVILTNLQGNILDEVKYADQWHFQLITNTQGVALERIDYNGPSTKENFHSAATSAGYGTPGYKNSQYKPEGTVQGSLFVDPEVFSPDNDGVDDIVSVVYTFPAPGNVANINIYDANGRLVRYLQKNALCGIKGVYLWDGLGDKMQKLPIGIYIILTEIFNVDGKRKQFKNTVVLARRLN